VKSEASQAGARRPDRFMTTRWSIVLSCTDSDGDEEKAHAALAELCKIYWRPVFAFICRQGHSVPDAQDLTQDFFAMVLKGRLLQRADRSRGRFRSLVLKALQNFLHDAVDKRHARKRGGDVQFVSWDDWMAEAPSHLSIPEQESDKWSPERIFDVRWAATVVERASAVLRRNAQTPVLVQADETVPYGRVVTGAVLLQQAGAAKIGFQTDPGGNERNRRR